MTRLIQTASEGWSDQRWDPRDLEFLTSITEEAEEAEEAEGADNPDDQDEPEETEEAKAEAETAIEKESIDSYTDQIIKTIPTEVVTAWLFIHELTIAGEDGIVNPVYYTIFVLMLLLTFSHLLRRTRSNRDMIPSSILTEIRYFLRMPHLRKRQIQLGTAAFIIWVIYLGGPITELSLLRGWYNQTVGAIFLAIFTVAIPIFIPEAEQRGRLQLSKFNFDKTTPSKEYIVFGNAGSATLDLSSWEVRVSDKHKYEFPSGFELKPKKRVVLRGGKGDDTSRELYWGKENPLGEDDDNKIVVRHPIGWKVLEKDS